MKKNRVYSIVSYTINLVLLGVIIISNKGIILNKNTITLKDMNESTQIADKEKTIDDLNTSQTEYSNYINTSKTNLAKAITNAGVSTSGTDSLETMITNVSKILSNRRTEILYAKTNGTYTSETNETLYIIATTGGLKNAYYKPTVTGGTLTQINYLNNYHDTWSCNTGIYEWSTSKDCTITHSKPINNTAYPVTMIILK